MDLKVIKKMAYDLMAGKRSRPGKEKGNKYYHGERVATTVIELRQNILPNDESYDEILIVSAWFHDIMNGEENHAENGAEIVRGILSDYCSELELNKIYKMIAEHDNRIHSSNEGNSYLKLLQDADLLDHYGISDIWINFLHYSSQDKAIIHVLDYFQNKHYKDIEQDRKLLNYDISVRIFDEKCKFLHEFTNRLKYEGIGKIYNLNSLI